MRPGDLLVVTKRVKPIRDIVPYAEDSHELLPGDLVLLLEGFYTYTETHDFYRLLTHRGPVFVFGRVLHRSVERP